VFAFPLLSIDSIFRWKSLNLEIFYKIKITLYKSDVSFVELYNGTDVMRNWSIDHFLNTELDFQLVSFKAAGL